MLKPLAVALTLVLVGSAAPALAEPAAPDCAEGNYCLWSGPDYTGQTKARALPVGQCLKPRVGWPDGTSSRLGSLYNNRTELSQLEGFDNDDCSGLPYAVVGYRQGVTSISDRLKSLRVAPRCSPGNICIYENKDFTGTRWEFGLSMTNRCFTASDDTWGYAFYNATTYEATFYASVACTFLPVGPVAPRVFGTFEKKVHFAKID
ncbi:peptidase inhibitor family I36 protein [Actinosynnema sp. NPDC020468]|uniref:peptidase inhibitor family I36 protein n=1 Tax=Actinosynnema sp. NPDC020468 TaxID=3154488 RepID=UPI0033EBD35A